MPSKLVDGKHDHVCFLVTTQQELKAVGFRIVVLYGFNSFHPRIFDLLSQEIRFGNSRV